MNFDTALQHILKLEGGLVDHPRDPGGITKYGISLKAYPSLGRDGIRNLTVQQAGEIYKRDYWDAVQADALPSELRTIVFDCAVNQGADFARKALQNAVGALQDGVIGPKTLAAIKRTPVYHLIHKYACIRFNRYSINPNWSVFKDGWMSRLLYVTLESRH